jgi:hypothetical protein
MTPITQQQYEAALRIVREYESQINEDLEDDYDGFDDEDEEMERWDQEDYERALACTCGAWVVGNDGKGYHVADCFCGAE